MKTAEIQHEINRLKGSLSHTEKRANIQTVDKNGDEVGCFRLDGTPTTDDDPEPLFTCLDSFFQLYLSDKRFHVYFSGRSSGKSHFMSQILLAESYEHQRRNLCLREKANSLQDSSYFLMRSPILENPVLTDHFDILSNKIVGVNGSEFIFKGLQSFTANSIKSYAGFTTCFVDEASALSRRSLDLLLPTIRAAGSKIYFSLNPENKDDPVYVDFVETDRKDTAKQKFSYLDNPFNSQETIDLAEHDKLNRPDSYSHVWDGQILIRSELRILTNWKIQDCSYKAVRANEHKLMDSFKTNKLEVSRNIKVYAGLDFGFNPDPTAGVLFYHLKNTDRIYIFKEYYKLGKTAKTLADELLEIEELDNYAPIVGDSSRPELIEELRRRGLNIRGSRKPRVLDDIGRLQNFEIFCDPSCKQTITALSLYSFKENKHTGEILNVPSHFASDCVDALRYGSMNISVLERREYKHFNNFKMG